MNFKIESSDQRARSNLSLPGALSAAGLFAGIGGSFASMFLPETPYVIPLCAGLGVILLSWLLRKSQRAPLILLALMTAAAVPGILWFHLADGVPMAVNRVSIVLGAYLGRNLTRYAASGMGGTYTAALSGGLLALGCVWMVRARSRLIPGLIALVAAALDILLGLSAAPVWIGLLFAGMLMLCLPEMLMLCDSGTGLLTWLAAALAAALIFCGASALLAENEIPLISEIHSTLMTRLEEACFGVSADGMPGGDFSALGICQLSSEPMLEITMTEPESLYLRGFVGSEYHSDGWKAASNFSLSDGADLFYWLHRGDFYGQTQLSKAAMLLDSEVTPDDAVQITVRHIGASRKYAYAPYELIHSDLLDPDAVGDVRLNSRSLTGEGEYSLVSSPNQVKRYTTLLFLLKAAEKEEPSGDLSGYLTSESHYNAFVYDHFLDLPEKTSEMLTELLGKPDYNGEAHLDYGEAKKRILEFLNNNIAYRETTPPRLEDSDFLNEFLNINASGYDVHYATAAVLMMRHFGIPARYVEGYLITPEDKDSAKPDEAFTLTGERAHAWCEIYQDGIGWVPFEVTPKYMDLMERSDAVRSSDPDNTPPPPPPETEEQPQEENSLDMEEDFHDDIEEEENPDDNPMPLEWLIYAALGLLGLLILLLLILWLSAQISLIRLNRSLKRKNRRHAVKNLYVYLFALIQEVYGWYDCVSPSGFLETVRADLGEDAAMKYSEVVSICEQSIFSTHGVKEDNYLFVYNYTISIRQLLKRRSGFRRRLKLRYIRHLI